MKSQTTRSVVLALSAFFDVLLNRGEFQCPILPREYRWCPRSHFRVGTVMTTSVENSHCNRSRIGSSFRNQLSIETYFITMVRYYSMFFFSVELFRVARPLHFCNTNDKLDAAKHCALSNDCAEHEGTPPFKR